MGWGCPSCSAGPGLRGCCWPVSRSRSCSPPGSRPCCGPSPARWSRSAHRASWPIRRTGCSRSTARSTPARPPPTRSRSGPRCARRGRGSGSSSKARCGRTQLQLPSPGNPTATRQILLASLAGISAQVTLTAGTWPGPPHRGGPVPAAVPAAVASQLHLTVGSVLTATPLSGGAAISLQVTGLFRANDPASPYWALDLLPVSGMSVQRYSASYAESAPRARPPATAPRW